MSLQENFQSESDTAADPLVGEDMTSVDLQEGETSNSQTLNEDVDVESIQVQTNVLPLPIEELATELQEHEEEIIVSDDVRHIQQPSSVNFIHGIMDDDDVEEEFITIDDPAEMRHDTSRRIRIQHMNRDMPTDEIVLPVLPPQCDPSATLTDESADCVDKSEMIYSSLPPDLNADVISRITHTPLNGENMEIIRMQDGSLRVRSLFGMMSDSSDRSHYDLTHAMHCIVCERTIAASEMFLNFPDDLDRRRVWGSLLGFKYNDMLRVRVTRVITTGAICTDHFSEECFRLYNFNKAAIEAYGVPKGVSPNKPFIKSRPWPCTVCTYSSYSVADTHEHIMREHMNEQTMRQFMDANIGFSCPFCRKCTYGYKTLNGFKRHMLSPPTDHGHLKKIWETAREQCRSSYLEPLFDWKSWTEKNVCLAYYGYEPTRRSPLKRRRSPLDDMNSKSGGPHSNARRNLNENSPTKKPHVDTSNKDSDQDDGTDIGPSDNEPAYPLNEHLYVNKDTVGECAPELEESVVEDHPLPEEQPKPQRAYIVLRRKGDANSALNKEGIMFTIADALVEPKDVAIEEEVFTQPMMLNSERLLAEQLDEKMYKRQIESIEARMRLFGDTSVVEVPVGYRSIDTEDGPRLVPIDNEIIPTPRRVTVYRRFAAN